MPDIHERPHDHFHRPNSSQAAMLLVLYLLAVAMIVIVATMDDAAPLIIGR